MSNTPTHGSDVQETPDWWKASDGRFYAPELHPDYVKPAAAAPVASNEPPSLAERLRAQADRVGDEASAAVDAGVGSMDSPRPSVGGARSTLDESPAAAAAPAVSPVVDPRATIPATPPVSMPPSTPPSVSSPGAPPSMPPSMPPSPGAPPSMPPSMPPSPGAPPAMPPAMPPSMPSPGAPPSMPPSMPPSPGAPPAMPPGMPPSPGAPPSMPPAPGSPPGMPPAPTSAPSMPPAPVAAAPVVEQGPGGITYTAPAEVPLQASFGAAPLSPQMSPPAPGTFQPPSTLAPAKASSAVAGLMAIAAGAAGIAASLINWGKGSVVGSNGSERAIIEVAGFDSSGIWAAAGGGVLLLAGILFFMGVPKQLYWAIAAFVSGAAIVGAVVFSFFDIKDLSGRYAAQWQTEGLALTGDVISTQPDLGLWIAAAAGVLGVLAAPFVNRS